MLLRFSLYGFFKNQQYFEPYLILVFLEKGLSFFEIGLLVALREIVVNLLEVPSGAIADLFGRRRSMITSFAAYIVSFLIFGVADALPLLALAMVFYGTGEAFRTGTHKAMIFAWLKREGRQDERTAVYGRTRSWSKLGSALSVVIATIFVLATNRFAPLFFLAIVPYVAGIVNFLGYPAFLDGAGRAPRDGGGERVGLLRHLGRSIATAWRARPVRRLLVESMAFEGLFKASKDYLQPVLKAAAIPAIAALGLGGALGEQQRAALLVGPVYVGLFLLSALAARNAHRVTARLETGARAGRALWVATLAIWALVLPAMYLEISAPIILGFVALYAVQNLFRPILIARLDAHVADEQRATLLSIENQSKSLATMLLAPALGAAVDLVATLDLGGRFWPVALVAVAICLVFSLAPAQRAAATERPDDPA